MAQWNYFCMFCTCGHRRVLTAFPQSKVRSIHALDLLRQFPRTDVPPSLCLEAPPVADLEGSGSITPDHPPTGPCSSRPMFPALTQSHRVGSWSCRRWTFGQVPGPTHRQNLGQIPGPTDWQAFRRATLNVQCQVEHEQSPHDPLLGTCPELWLGITLGMRGQTMCIWLSKLIQTGTPGVLQNLELFNDVGRFEQKYEIDFTG